MKEFYRSICQRREQLQEAVSAAERELRDPNDKVRATSSPVLGVRILRGVYDSIRPGEPLTEHAIELIRKLREAGLPVPAQVGDAMPAVILECGHARIKEAWDSWFPLAAQRERARRSGPGLTRGAGRRRQKQPQVRFTRRRSLSDRCSRTAGGATPRTFSICLV
jgi:hypothetical protein